MTIQAMLVIVIVISSSPSLEARAGKLVAVIKNNNTKREIFLMFI